MIQATGLSKSYGGTVAVADLSFAIERGETFGLLGPNGAGKTTTILMLTGAIAPDAGAIEIDGHCDPTRADVRRRIGVAPQTLSLYDELTGAENLAFFARLYGLGGKALDESVDAALAFAGLEGRRRDRVGTYSGGMQRRLNLAAALVHDPPVLILDEPTVGVDPQSRSHIFEGIERLKAAGKTILYTTHYMEEVERLCDRVAIVDHGRLLALDTVAGLLRDHGGPSVVEAEFEPRLDGAQVRLETDRPLEEVARLTASGVPLVSLHVHRPNLETVFLKLTGRRLRDT